MITNSRKDLPDSYEEIFSVNLKKNKGQMILVNVISAIIAILMLAAMFVFDLFPQVDIWDYLVLLIISAVGFFAYVILHELIHGIFMILFGCKKPKFGFTLMYAYAKGDYYFAKVPYIIIGLAPVVIFGVLLAFLGAILPSKYAFVAYLIQILNLSGASGDLYVTVRFLFLPRDILIYDTGIGMTVYSEKGKK